MERTNTRYRYSEIIIEKNLPLLGHIIYNLLIACVCGCGSARPSRQTDRQPGSLGGREGEVVCSGPWDWTIRCKCVYTHSIKYNILTGNKWLWFVDARRNSNRAVISVIIIPLVIIIKCVWTRDQRAKSKSRTNRSIGQRSLIKRVISQVTGGNNLE